MEIHPEQEPLADKQFAKDKQKLSNWIKRRLTRAEITLKNYQDELEKCSLWNSVQHEATLLQANFFRLKRGLTSLSVLDWENENREKMLVLDPLLDPAEQVAGRFKQSKKMQRALLPLSKMVEKSIKNVEHWSAIALEAEKINDQVTLIAFQERIGFAPIVVKKKAEVASPMPFHRYISQTGVQIWVGKNARGNDRLTFHYASGNDWWLHASGFSGSHVVIKGQKGEEPDSETLADALQLALHFSKARERGEGEVCITQRKFVSRIPSALGKVQISKHKNIFIKADPERIKKMKKE